VAGIGTCAGDIYYPFLLPATLNTCLHDAQVKMFRSHLSIPANSLVNGTMHVIRKSRMPVTNELLRTHMLPQFGCQKNATYGSSERIRAQ
jgi:hypothetical protein